MIKSQPTCNITVDTAFRMPIVVLCIAVLAPIFYLMEHHNANVSQLKAFHINGDEMAELAAKGDGARRLAIPVLGLFGAWLLTRPWGSAPRCASWLGWMLIAYLGWCMLSITWSPDLGLTVRHVAVLIICLVGALGLAQTIDLHELCLVTLGVTTILVINSLLSELRLGTFHPFESEYRFAGNLHPNVQAPYCALLALSAACCARQARRGRILLWMLCLIGVGLMLLTKSRTVCGVFAAGIVVYALFNSPWQTKLMAATAGLGLGCAIIFVALLAGWEVEQHAKNIVLIGRHQDNEALSGRLPLWASLLPQWWEHPLLGYGYQTFWSPERIAKLSHRVQWTVSNSHSALLDHLLDLGVIGGVLCLLIGVVGLLDVGQRFLTGRNIGIAFLVALLAGRSAIALLESAYLNPTNFVSFVLMCGLLHVAFYRAPEETKQEFAPQGDLQWNCL